MAHTVTLQLPDEMLRRYQHGASAARKNLEAFMVERLAEAVPPLSNESYPSIDDELTAMEQADDKTLWDIAQSIYLSANKNAMICCWIRTAKTR